MRGDSNHEPEYRRRKREKAARQEQSAERRRYEADQKGEIARLVAAIEALECQLDRSNDQQSAERKQYEAENKAEVTKLVAAIEALERQLARGNDQSSPKTKWDRIWERASTVALIAAAAVGLLAIVVSSRDSEQQRNVMEADRRPWVSVEIAIGGITWDEKGANISLHYELRNTGRSPAMHVSMRDELLLFLADDPKKAPLVRVKKIAEEMRSTNDTARGFPLFPGETRPIYVTRVFAREDVEKFKEFLGTFKHDANDSPPPSIPDAQLMVPVAVAYVVDYGFDVGQGHHQSYCWVLIGRANPTNPLGPGLMIPIDKDFSGDQLRLDEFGISCEAD